MLDSYNTDPKRDLAADRLLVLDNGNSYHIVKKDPYGFWWVHMDKGQVPDELKGSYTSAKYAEDAVRNYVSRQGSKQIKEFKEKKV